MNHSMSTAKAASPFSRSSMISTRLTGAPRPPRLVPDPRPFVMSEKEYGERLNVLLHTDRCRPQTPWVSADVAKPELVWEPEPHTARRAASPTLPGVKGSAPTDLVARIKSEGEASHSLGRGENSCGVLPAWRSPSPSRVPHAERYTKQTVVCSSPRVYTISDEDEAEKVEVSQLRQGSARRSASASATRTSPAPKRQLKLSFTPPTTANELVQNVAATAGVCDNNKSNHEERLEDERTPEVVADDHNARSRGGATRTAGRKRHASSTTSATPPSPCADTPQVHGRHRASSSGSSVLVLSAMPPAKNSRTAAAPGASADGDTALPRTIDAFLRTNN